MTTAATIGAHKRNKDNIETNKRERVSLEFGDKLVSKMFSINFDKKM